MTNPNENSKMASVAIYPGSFDPITYGHIDLIERATKLFDQVIVAVAHNKNKLSCFNIEERLQLCQQVLRPLQQVKVEICSQLTVEFAQQRQANILLRGVRVSTDFDFEFQLAGMNRQLMPEIETLFLVPSEKYCYLSSSLIKEIAATGKDVSQFVPNAVSQALHKKFSP